MMTPGFPADEDDFPADSMSEFSPCVSMMTHGIHAEEDAAYPAYPADRRVKVHVTQTVCTDHWSPSMDGLAEVSDPAAEEAR